MPFTPAGKDSSMQEILKLVRTDSRDAVATRDTDPPSLCAFVARERERISAISIMRLSVVIVAEGAKELVQAGRSQRFVSGAAVAIAPGWRGDVVNEPDPRSGRYRALFIDFPPDLVTRVLCAHPQWRPEEAGPAVRGLKPIALAGPLAAAVLHMAAGRRTGIKACLLEHRAMEVLLTLADQGGLPAETLNFAGSVSNSVRGLLRWRPDKSWTAAVVARELALSEATLRRRLAAEGTSFGLLLRAERLEYAHALIAEGKMKIGDAAAATGFGSRSRFARRFKERYGMSPSALKRPI